MHPIGIVLILLLALGGPAAAQAPNPAPTPDAPAIPDAKTLATNYELASALGDRKCAVTLDVRPRLTATMSTATIATPSGIANQIDIVSSRLAPISS